MNERIRELEKQSYITFKDENSFDCLVFSKEKFAELIVKECAKAVEDSIWHLPRGYKAVDQAKFVKKHFGVEE